MSSNRPRTLVRPIVLRTGGNARYLRWSTRYGTWQVQDKLMRGWRNVRPELARAYAAAGFGVF